MTTVLSGVHLVDAQAPEPRPDAWVLIDDDAIRDVGHGAIPRADRQIDLGGAWLLPGLWDVHTHLRSTTWTGREPIQTFPDVVLEQGCSVPP